MTFKQWSSSKSWSPSGNASSEEQKERSSSSNFVHPHRCGIELSDEQRERLRWVSSGSPPTLSGSTESDEQPPRSMVMRALSSPIASGSEVSAVQR